MSTDFNVFRVLEGGFAPTPEEAARRMLEVARLRRGEVLYDLGSGDGRLLVLAAREFGAYAVGVELQRKLVEESRRRIRHLGLEGVARVIRGDLFEMDVSGADVLALYFTPRALERVRLKLERELRRGTRVVVYKHPLEVWAPTEVHAVTLDGRASEIFLYEV